MLQAGENREVTGKSIYGTGIRIHERYPYQPEIGAGLSAFMLPKSVTHVLTIKCYLCVDHSRKEHYFVLCAMCRPLLLSQCGVGFFKVVSYWQSLWASSEALTTLHAERGIALVLLHRAIGACHIKVVHRCFVI